MDEYYKTLLKINSIREIGLGNMIQLPQIVVVGNQSSGKSSILEYISNINFPKSDNMCTRFATQITTKNSNDYKYKLYFSSNKNNFKEGTNIKEIEDLINEYVKEIDDDIIISDELLVIEVEGKEYIDLTLIDLPGYIENVKDGQDKNLINKIYNIIDTYIKNERCIILSILPCNTDLASNKVINHAEIYDIERNRTIGVLTKPDLLDKGTEEKIIRIIENKEINLKLGYYIIKNKSYNDNLNNITRENAIINENDFFNKGLWCNIHENKKGLDSLIKILSKSLSDLIRKEYPKLKTELENIREITKKELDILGPEINNNNKTFMLMKEILKFYDIINCVFEGNYKYINIERDELKIRSIIENKNISFFNSIQDNKYNEINEDEIKTLIDLNKGKELPGQINFNTFSLLVKKYIVNWESITLSYINSILKLLNEKIPILIKENIHPLFVDYFIKIYFKILDNNKNSCIKEFNIIFDEEKTPQTYNYHYFTSVLVNNKIKNEEIKYYTIDDLKEILKYDDNSQVSIMTENIKAYIKTTSKRFVDNICIQCIERHLIKGLIKNYFENLNNIKIESIKEDDSIINKRSELTERLLKLEDILFNVL